MFYLIFVIFIISSVNSQYQEIPKIIKVEVDNSSKIIIYWDIPNDFDYGFSRYKVQYASINNNVQNEYKYWPILLKKVDFKTKDPGYLTITTKSNIECYNQCINDINCKYVERYYALKNNCVLKTFFNESNQQELKNGDEAFIIKNISKTIEIDYFMLYGVYKFRISVYDNICQCWSEFSDDSEVINMTIGFDVSVNLNTRSNLLVKWDITSPYKNINLISLYSIKVFFNESEFYNKNIILKPESYTQIDPQYIDIYSNDTLIIETSENFTCKQLCSSYNKCVYYAYVSKNDDLNDFIEGYCVIKSQLNIENGISLPDYIYSFNKISKLNKFLYENINNYTTYSFQLNAITPYGEEYNSNIYKYQQKILPLNYAVEYNKVNFSIKLKLNIDGISPLARLIVNYTIDDEELLYFYNEQSSFFEDPDIFDGEGNDFNDCYERCIFNEKCLAISWGLYPFNCSFTTKINKPLPCNEAACITVSKLNEEINIDVLPYSRRYCFNLLVRDNENDLTYFTNEKNCVDVVPFVVETFSNTTRFIEGETIEFYCHHNYENNEQIIKNIRWFFNDLENNDYFNEPIIKITNLNHSLHNGVYYCQIDLHLNTKIYQIKSNNTILVAIEYPISIEVPKRVESNQGDYVEISCIIDGYPLPEFAWRVSGSKTDINTTRFENKNLILYFENINKEQNKIYECYNKDVPTKLKSVEVIVKSKPSKPIIESLQHINKDLNIKWKTVDNGHSEIIKLVIEISKNFNFSNTLLFTINIPFKELKNEEYNLSNVEYDGYFIRIKLENILGLSEPSEEKLIQQIIINENSDNDSKNEKFKILFYVTCCGLVLFTIGFIYTIIYRRVGKKKKRSGSTIIHENEEIMNYIPKFLVAERPPDAELR